MRIVSRKALPLLLLPGLLLACGDADSGLLGPADATHATFGSTLVECPTNQTRSASRTIGLLGGTLELNGHRISIPAGALLAPTTFTLTEPASNYMEIRIKADGLDSFEFLDLVSITVSYDRCTRSNIASRDLTAWKIDPATKALLKHMGGEDDKAARSVTFLTPHLSGFAIAN